MFSTIIVGVDGREGGRDALALAERLRRLSGGEIVAVHAYPYEYVVSRGSNADFEAVMRDDVHKELDAELARAAVKASAVAVPDGSPARALHDAAESHDAGLIVVGSAHRGRIGRVFAGDIASGTLHGSPCPVLVAPGGYAHHDVELATIGVAFDGSPESRAAVDVARDLAVAAGARLKVLTVLEPMWPSGSYLSSYHDFSEDSETAREAATTRLDALVAELGPNVSGELLEGDAARELAFEGKELDLLVCGSRAYGPLGRLLLGSTSGRLVREATCPIMVLPRGVSEDVVRDDAAVAAHTA
jgi:nucleotide-binding universal stress UspA family protein